jgi:chromosome segregation ATPase
MSQQQIEEATSDLRKELLEKIEDLGRAFESVKHNIETKIAITEEEISSLKSEFDEYSMTKRNSVDFQVDKSSISARKVRESVHLSSLRPRRELLRSCFERGRAERVTRLMTPCKKSHELKEAIIITTPLSQK